MNFRSFFFSVFFNPSQPFCDMNYLQRLRNHLPGPLWRTKSVDYEKQMQQEQQLWSTTVPPEIVSSVSDSERKRQEIIFEIVQTEKEFVDDLLLVQTAFVRPLLESDVIEPDRKQSFLSSVFLNIGELYNINSKLKRKLIARQNEDYIVHSVGDIFLNIVDEFYPYVDYGAGQILAKFLMDEEKNNNPEFAKFLKVISYFVRALKETHQE